MAHFEIQKVIDEVPEAVVYNIVGQGRAGKTYSIKKYWINHFLETGKMCLYVRRSVDEVKPKFIGDLFDDVLENEVGLKKALDDKYMTDTHIWLHGGEFWICGMKENGVRKKLDCIGKAMSVKNAPSAKGAPFVKFDTIFYDEVITDGFYYKGDEEVDLFERIVNTIAIDGKNVKIFICGNADKNIEQCPYFYKLKIDYQKMDRNKIYTFDNVALDGRVIKNNIVFVKVGSNAEHGFMNLSVAGLFGTAEAYMRLTGDVKTDEYNIMTRKEMQDKDILCEINTETAVILDGFYHKNIYVYVGYNDIGPCLYITTHKLNTDKDMLKLYSFYDELHKRPDINADSYLYRLGFTTYQARVASLFDNALKLKNLFTDSNYTAQTFYNLINKDL